MSDDVRVYRLARSLTKVVALVVVALVAVFAYGFLKSQSDFDRYGMLFLICTLGAAGLAVAWYFLTGATYATSDGLVTRGFRTRTTLWSEVAAIQVEGTAGQWTTSSRAVVYDTSGHRRGLPQVNDHNRINLTKEVEQLKGLWRRNRGPHWLESSAAAAVRGARRPKPVSGFRVYLGSVALEFFMAASTVVVIDLIQPELSPGLGVGVILVLTCGLAALTAIVLPVQRYLARRDARIRPHPMGKRQR